MDSSSSSSTSGMSNSAGCTADSQDPLCLTTQALNQASQVQAPAVAISAGAWLGLGLATILVFQVLRPNNKIVYAPKLKYADSTDKAPPRAGDGFFSWLPPLFQYHEADLLPVIGLDAITFLRFLRMCRYLTMALALLMSVVLMPINIVYNARNPPTADSISFLTRLSMARVSGSFLWAHVAMSYLGALLAIAFIYYNYKRMLVLRHAWFRSPEYQTQFHARTLMITGVKRPLQSDEALAGVLSSIGMPYPTTEVHIGRVVGALPDLIEKHNDLVRALERVFAKYLKDPNNLPAKRPTVTIGAKAGCGGKRVDAIDYYTDQINKCEAAIANWRERIAEKRPESYGFASLAAVAYAHAAARSLQGKKPRGLVIDLAPAPKDIIWQNLNLTPAERFRSSAIGAALLTLLMFFNAVPLLAVSLITNMASFRNVSGFTWLNSWYTASQWTFAAVSALIPPAITGVMGYFLPIGMRRLAKYRGVLTRSRLDRVIVGQYFGFLVISQFLIFTLIGIIITLVAYIVTAATRRKENYKDILVYIQNHLPGQIKSQYFLTSNYWLTWLPLRGFLAILDLAQVIKLLLVWFQKAFFGRTPRDVREYTKPPNFDYAVYYANLLFMFAVAMLYAPLVPLVVVFSSAAFWVSSLVYKYQLMYVFTTKNESGGRLWRVVVNRMLVCIVFMQLILTLAIALDQGYIKSVAALPPILFVLAFKIYLSKTFDRHFTWYIPTASELAKETVHTGDSRHNRLQRRFGHPALHEKLFTPMVHAKVKHLLPRIYSGRIEETTKLDGDTMATTRVTGGLKITAVEESQLEWSLERERDDDARSIMSGTTMANLGAGQGGRVTPPFGSPGTYAGVGANGAASTDYFKSQYAAYLAGGTGTGAQRGGGAGSPSMVGTMDDFEMGHVAKGSRDNLLDHAESTTLVGHYAPVHGQAYVGAGPGSYGHSQSQHGTAPGSVADLYAGGGPGAEYYASPAQDAIAAGAGAVAGYPIQHAHSRSGDAGMMGIGYGQYGHVPQRSQGSFGPAPVLGGGSGAGGVRPGTATTASSGGLGSAQQHATRAGPVPGPAPGPGPGQGGMYRGAGHQAHPSQGSYGSGSYSSAAPVPSRMNQYQQQLQQQQVYHHQRQGTVGSMGSGSMLLGPSGGVGVAGGGVPTAMAGPGPGAAPAVSPAAQVQAQYQQRQSMLLQQQQQQLQHQQPQFQQQQGQGQGQGYPYSGPGGPGAYRGPPGGGSGPGYRPRR